ncbi:MAG TPA: hypothetical protein VIY71_01400 [Solirubrobacterales bacterium]
MQEQAVTVSTWLPASEAATLRRRAVAADRSIAAEVRRLLRAALDESGGE